MEREQFDEWFTEEFRAHFRAMFPPEYGAKKSRTYLQDQATYWLARLLPWAEDLAKARREGSGDPVYSVETGEPLPDGAVGRIEMFGTGPAEARLVRFGDEDE